MENEIDIVNQYIISSYPKDYSERNEYKLHIVRRMECVDGFSMSVQGHFGAYCSPRVNFASRYDSLEIGFPSEREDIIMPYIDGEDSDPTQTVYGYVPVNVIVEVIKKHGGILGSGIGGN